MCYEIRLSRRTFILSAICAISPERYADIFALYRTQGANSLQNRARHHSFVLQVSLVLCKPQCRSAPPAAAHALNTMKILTARRESHHTPALRPNGALDAASLPVIGKEELATVKIVVEIQNRRVIPPRVRGIFLHAGILVLYHAVISVDLVAQIRSVRRRI